MNKFIILNIFPVLILISINLFFIHKDPLYKDENLKNLISYIDLNIEKDAIIQMQIEQHVQYEQMEHDNDVHVSSDHIEPDHIESDNN